MARALLWIITAYSDERRICEIKTNRQDGGHFVEQMIENGRRGAQKTVNQATDAIRNVDAKNLMHQAQHWFGSAKPYLSDVAKKSTSLTRRYPLQALVGAAVCGFLCAAVFRRRAMID